MNLLEGTRENGTVELGKAGTVPIQVDGTTNEVSLGIRPEDISVTETPPETGHAIEGTVDTVEPLGEYTIVNAKVDGQLVKAKESSIDLERGDQVYLTFDDTAAHLYDEEGLRLAR